MGDNADALQARLFVPDSNTVAGQRILDNAPQPAPGFGQFMGFLEALARGTIHPVNLAPDVPVDVSVHRGLVFCAVGDRNLELDLFTPGNAIERVPVVVLIHGGCWMAGTRQDMEFYGVALARLGYATATVDYRLSEEAPYPAAVDDCRAAINWLRDNSEQHNIDADRIAVLGASAGGHLAQFLGYIGVPAVKAVVSLYGWTDLTDPAVNYQYYMELFLGTGYPDAPELYERASPIAHVHEGAPATLILGGTIDTIVPITQAQKLARTLAHNDVPYVYAPVRGAYHGFDMFTDFNPTAMYFIEQFLAAYLGTP
ncbi:MAG TPA: alpha/beta hydrolase [Mycobacterium sp.]|uniref:alpha/beta hydrolase n=1 Tax=Mycobacterium sp. TaxID=1785 RepID=UPI002B63F10A|nr:alpha/beta hydrolase [Mycobacterium sp.]HME75314.1 alpha/beta hydrolase [Mycobacterium sp.]